MSSSDILIALVVSIAANLLTPSVRKVGARAFWNAAFRLRAFGRNAIERRLRQLQDERSEIESLKGNPGELTNRLAYYMLPQVFALWIVVALLLVAHLIFDGNIFQTAWGGAIAGLIGYATRYPIGSILAISDLGKINEIEKYRAKNDALKRKMEVILGAKPS